MSCYNPKIAMYGPVNEDTGKNRIVIGPVFDGKDPLAYELLKNGNIFLIPCNKCIGCKLDYSRSWADRMMLEYEARGKAVFVTLTYDDYNLPNVNPETGQVFNFLTDLNDAGAPVAPLIKKDLSEFIKCLRSKFSDNGHDIKFSFFGCGEYGSERHRPHFHIILFGVGFEDLQIQFSGNNRGILKDWITNELGQVSYRSNLLEDVWKNRGIVTVSETSYETMGYVSRYSLKKAQGDTYPEEYHLPKEFTLMSRNPGIGLKFLDEHQDQVESVDSWFVRGKQIYWPKYILNKYSVDTGDGIKYYDRDENDDFLAWCKERRRLKTLNNFIKKFENSDKTYQEKQLELERKKTESVKQLKRGDVTLE